MSVGSRLFSIIALLLLGGIRIYGFSVEDCLECHGDGDILSDAEYPRKGLVVPANVFLKSVHGQQKCTDCHVDATDDHEPRLKPAVCGECHGKEVRNYQRSRHHEALMKKSPYAPTCVTCHGKHDMLAKKNSNSPTNVMNIPVTCGKCHREGSKVEFYDVSQTNVIKNYSMSIHGKGLFEDGLKVTAVCVSCHTSHEIQRHSDVRSSIHRKNISSTCMECHAAIEQVHKKVVKGREWKSEFKVPVCIDCHLPHKIKNIKDAVTFNDEDCLKCHSKRDSGGGLAVLDTLLAVDLDHSANSVHKEIPCVKCHVNVSLDRDPVCHGSGKVDCGSCHSETAQSYERSTHGKLAREHDPDAPGCVFCHGSHKIPSRKDPDSPIARENVPELCAHCHRKGEKAAMRLPDSNRFVEKYQMSIHGQALDHSGLTVSAICIDCHSSHAELPASDENSSVHRDNISSTCSKCHKGILKKFRRSIHSPVYNPGASEKLPVCNDCHSSHNIERVEHDAFRQNMVDQCGHCHEKLTMSYMETYHGKATKVGAVGTAKCSDCHGSHSILPPHDSLSTLGAANIEKTCGKCHGNVNENFTRYQTHADHRDRVNYPVVYWTWFLMTSLLLSVLAVFLLHTALWFFRESLHAARHFRPLRRSPKHMPEHFQTRYHLWHRLTHLLVIVSFLGLAATGIPLKYSQSAWAKSTMSFIGGYQVAGFLHRVCAALTLAYVIMHLGWLVYQWRKSRRQLTLKAVFGPESMMFRWKDLGDMAANIRWFLFLGPRPKFDRWTYWDKFDYWGEFWGVTVIGSTGLLLWFPGFFSHFLPGWIFNIATVIHSVEALLAACIIFLVHFFNVHLRPSKFPMDPVIFTGCLPEEEMEEEHPLEYERLKQSGELEKGRRPGPGKVLLTAARIFGISAFSFGIFLIVTIMFTEIRQFFQ